MSGGSYNYLHRQIDTSGSLDIRDLRNMSERLDVLAPGSAAAAATRRMLEAMEDKADLREVWRAVEWLDSGDSDADEVTNAVAAYERRDGIGSTR